MTKQAQQWVFNGRRMVLRTIVPKKTQSGGALTTEEPIASAAQVTKQPEVDKKSRRRAIAADLLKVL